MVRSGELKGGGGAGPLLPVACSSTEPSHSRGTAVGHSSCGLPQPVAAAGVSLGDRGRSRKGGLELAGLGETHVSQQSALLGYGSPVDSVSGQGVEGVSGRPGQSSAAEDAPGTFLDQSLASQRVCSLTLCSAGSRGTSWEQRPMPDGRPPPSESPGVRALDTIARCGLPGGGSIPLKAFLPVELSPADSRNMQGAWQPPLFSGPGNQVKELTFARQMAPANFVCAPDGARIAQNEHHHGNSHGDHAALSEPRGKQERLRFSVSRSNNLPSSETLELALHLHDPQANMSMSTAAEGVNAHQGGWRKQAGPTPTLTQHRRLERVAACLPGRHAALPSEGALLSGTWPCASTLLAGGLEGAPVKAEPHSGRGDSSRGSSQDGSSEESWEEKPLEAQRVVQEGFPNSPPPPSRRNPPSHTLLAPTQFDAQDTEDPASWCRLTLQHLAASSPHRTPSPSLSLSLALQQPTTEVSLKPQRGSDPVAQDQDPTGTGPVPLAPMQLGEGEHEGLMFARPHDEALDPLSGRGSESSLVRGTRGGGGGNEWQEAWQDKKFWAMRGRPSQEEATAMLRQMEEQHEQLQRQEQQDAPQQQHHHHHHQRQQQHLHHHQQQQQQQEEEEEDEEQADDSNKDVDNGGGSKANELELGIEREVTQQYEAADGLSLGESGRISEEQHLSPSLGVSPRLRQVFMAAAAAAQAAAAAAAAAAVAAQAEAATPPSGALPSVSPAAPAAPDALESSLQSRWGPDSVLGAAFQEAFQEHWKHLPGLGPEQGLIGLLPARKRQVSGSEGLASLQSGEKEKEGATSIPEHEGETDDGRYSATADCSSRAAGLQSSALTSLERIALQSSLEVLAPGGPAPRTVASVRVLMPKPAVTPAVGLPLFPLRPPPNLGGGLMGGGLKDSTKAEEASSWAVTRLVLQLGRGASDVPRKGGRRSQATKRTRQDESLGAPMASPSSHATGGGGPSSPSAPSEPLRGRNARPGGQRASSRAGPYLQNLDGCFWRKNGSKKVLVPRDKDRDSDSAQGKQEGGDKDPLAAAAEDGEAATTVCTTRTYFLCAKCYSVLRCQAQAPQHPTSPGSSSSRNFMPGKRKAALSLHSFPGLHLVQYYKEHVHSVAPASASASRAGSLDQVSTNWATKPRSGKGRPRCKDKEQREDASCDTKSAEEALIRAGGGESEGFGGSGVREIVVWEMASQQACTGAGLREWTDMHVHLIHKAVEAAGGTTGQAVRAVAEVQAILKIQLAT